MKKQFMVLCTFICISSCGNYFHDMGKDSSSTTSTTNAPIDPPVDPPVDPPITPPVVPPTTNSKEQFTAIYKTSVNDEVIGFVRTNDGGYCLVGNTQSGAGGYDVFLSKTDCYGNIVWQKTYGGTLDDRVYAVIKSSSGQIVFIGETYSFGNGSSDVWIVKLSQSGDIIWEKTFGGTNIDYGVGVAETGGGDFIAIANTKSFGKGKFDMWALKISSSDGALKWEETLGGVRDNIAYGMAKLDYSDLENYAIWGTCEDVGTGYYDGMVYSIGKDGELNSSTMFRFGGNARCTGVSMTADEGYIVTGQVPLAGKSYDGFFIMKINPDKKWGKVYSGSKNIQSCSLVRNGSIFYLSGSTNATASNTYDFWVSEFDDGGNSLRHSLFGESGSEYLKYFNSNGNGGFMIVGSSDVDGTFSNEGCIVNLDSSLSAGDSSFARSDLSLTEETGLSVSLLSGTEYSASWNLNGVSAVNSSATVKTGILSVDFR